MVRSRRWLSLSMISSSLRCALLDGGTLADEQLHRAGDRGQRVADLVREAGRELADRRHAVLDAQLLPASASQRVRSWKMKM